MFYERKADMENMKGQGLIDIKEGTIGYCPYLHRSLHQNFACTWKAELVSTAGQYKVMADDDWV